MSNVDRRKRHRLHHRRTRSVKHALGSLLESSLQELWQGADFESLRQTHRQENYDKHPLCTACDDWHRP